MSTIDMARKKNFNRNPQSEAIAKAILENYKPGNVEEMQEALKDVFGPLFEAMLQGEMDNHLGYQSNDHHPKDTENRPVGIVLGANKDELLMEYALAGIDNNLFAARYQLYLPNKEELQEQLNRMLKD